MSAKIDIEEEVKEYLKLKKKSTAESYGTQFRRFLRYYKAKYGGDADFNHLLDRLDTNMQLPRRDRKLLAELEMSEYIDHLKKQGYANNTIRLNFTAIQNFLKYKGHQLSSKWVGNFPPALTSKKNDKHRWTLEQMKEFVDKAPNYRLKAIILAMFQSGMAINELCNLDYGDVERELKEGKLPLMLDVVREKTGTRYQTFLGADAVKYLRLYLETRSDLEPDSPLFTKWNSDVRITPAAIQFQFREMAEKLNYIECKDGEYNPARPHSMRSAFRSRLTGKMDPDLIEFLMGHTISGTRAPYINLPDEELRELYAQFEHQLSIESTSQKVNAGLDRQGSEIDEKYRKRVEDFETTLRTQASQLSQLSELNSRLSYEVGELREERGADMRGLGEEAQETLMEFVSLLKQPEIRGKFLAFLQELTEEAE